VIVTVFGHLLFIYTRPVAGYDYPGHGVSERGGQAGHPQRQAHPTHPPGQGDAYTSDEC